MGRYAIILALLIIAISSPTHGQQPSQVVRHDEPPFHCDSLEARVCFEIYARQRAMTVEATTFVAPTASTGKGNQPSGNCTFDLPYRGDRCKPR
jgi:hypothetical protein